MKPAFINIKDLTEVILEYVKEYDKNHYNRRERSRYIYKALITETRLSVLLIIAYNLRNSDTTTYRKSMKRVSEL